MNTMIPLDSASRWNFSDWAYMGQRLFLMGKELTTASQKDRVCSHAYDYRDLAHHVLNPVFTPIEIAVLEGIRNDSELFRAAGINKASALENPATLARRGVQLAKTTKPSRVIGFALIGRTRFSFREEWVCISCFRQARLGSGFCDLHSPTENPARYRHALRAADHYVHAIEIALRHGYGEPVCAKKLQLANSLCDAIGTREIVRDAYSLKEHLRVMGTFAPQPPKQWKKLIGLWQSRYTSCPRAIEKARSWSQVVEILRSEFGDKYCESEDYDLWDAKLLANDAELNATVSLKHCDGRRGVKTKTVDAIRRLAQEGLGKAAIAEKLGVRKSTISNALRRHPHLERFFLTTTSGCKSGVNIESNRVTQSFPESS